MEQYSSPNDRLISEKIHEEAVGLRSAITISQALIGFIGVIITCSFFIFSIRADVTATGKDVRRLEGWAKEHEIDEKAKDVKYEQNQKDIMQKLEAIQLTLKDKQDKKE